MFLHQPAQISKQNWSINELTRKIVFCSDGSYQVLLQPGNSYLLDMRVSFMILENYRILQCHFFILCFGKHKWRISLIWSILKEEYPGLSLMLYADFVFL